MDRPTAEDYADLFETNKLGARILEDLILRFIRPPVSQGGIDAILQTYDRAGQRKPVDYIIRQINSANGVQTEEVEDV